MYYCPECPQSFETLPAIKEHYMHSHNSSVCPICGKPVRKSLACHAKMIWQNRGCELHATLYYLLRTGRGGSAKNNGLYRKAREVAEKVLSSRISWNGGDSDE
ncbi:zinc finger C2H2-type domain protein [Archaeoglobus profundus DSM 5631]|uniref:Zinc finger C2H2-type domain protein n=1 Tax=Archaeoglobus profundus (strain DSM 5631 / JCM 9629 / NBRC 100127 / Av18) TaxID=572546 RepID=D2REL8_ARCPA|nr:zinc finger C2H2-type domain protein [Archaeoglobus profundus DSM 5631]